MAFTPLWIGSRKLILAIAGRKSTSPNYNGQTAEAALMAGRMAATLGLTVLTGGLTGVMEEACRGAKLEGGETLGILPGERHADGNRYLDCVLPSGLGILRNSLIACACDFMLALPGGTGTLEEICFALDFGRPVLSWGSWEIPGVVSVPFPKEADLRQAVCSLIANLPKQ